MILLTAKIYIDAIVANSKIYSNIYEGYFYRFSIIAHILKKSNRILVQISTFLNLRHDRNCQQTKFTHVHEQRLLADLCDKLELGR